MRKNNNGNVKHLSFPSVPPPPYPPPWALLVWLEPHTGEGRALGRAKTPNIRIIKQEYS